MKKGEVKLTCGRCKVVLYFANGYNAQAVTQEQINKAAERAGWKVNPFRCPACQVTEEMAKT